MAYGGGRRHDLAALGCKVHLAVSGEKPAETA